MLLNVEILRNNILITWVAEMGMLRWVSGNIWKDRIWNEEICFKIGVGPIDEKMRRVVLDGLVIFRGDQLMHW